MRYSKFVLILMLIGLITNSISAEVIGKTDEKVKAIAEPVLDCILEGFKTNDYTKYSRDFDDILKETISADEFHKTNTKIQNSIGNYISREYLGFMVRGQMNVVLWKGRFSKSEDDVLIELSISKRNNEYKVTGLWFK